MQEMAVLFGLFAALAAGAAAMWLAMRTQERSSFERGSREAMAEVASLRERVAGREAQVVELQGQLDAALTRTQELTRDLAQARTRAEEQHKYSEARIAELTNLQEQLGAGFRAISAEALQVNNQAFLDLAATAMAKAQEAAKGDLDLRQQAIGELVKPLREQLEKVDSRIVSFEKEQSGMAGAITQQVESLVKAQQNLQAETKNLVFALRAPATRGRWGEVQLRRVVEMAGMVEYCDFEEQASVQTENGSLRPDMVVQLPNHRRIVIDSKVSLAAYLESLEAPDELTRAMKLKQHAEQVRSHLMRLSGKQYWDQFPQSPEFVVAFLPGETFFSAALEQDPTLVEYGVERRVILATPTTLIALLKAIAYGWKQEQLSANAKEIRDLGKTLYERVRGMAEHFADLRTNLERTNKSFNKTVGSLEARVLPSARKFKELGAGSGEEIAEVPEIETIPRSLLVEL